jgi:hypothetical protein
MLNLLKKLVNPEEILKVQNCQYQEYILLEDTIPANSQKLCSVNVSSLGHFLCISMTGHFTTLFNDGQQVTDAGISYLRGKLLDGSNNRPLFNDYIPLDLFLSPGRKKSPLSATVATDAAPGTLFYPTRLEYTFAINSQILFDVKNDSNVDNKFSVLFQGVRFPIRHQR